MAHSRSIRSRRMTVALAILGLVYSLGVCPAGCLEANHWYALAHHLIAHDADLPACGHEGLSHEEPSHQDPSHEAPTEHGDCDGEPDRALLVSGRSLDLSPLVVWGLPAPRINNDLTPSTSAAPGSSHHRPRDTGPTATLRAQCQLFRC